MADHRVLGRLGWAFGAVTAAVLLTTAVVVMHYSDQRPSAGDVRFAAAATPSSGAHDFAGLFQPR